MSFRRMRHVKAREFQGCDVAFDFSNPANLYDATSGGSLVAADGGIARSNDVSGGSANATQGTSANRPLRKVASLNGLDSALFDGSNDVLSAGDVGDLLDKPIEVFSVHKRTSNTRTYPGIFGKYRAVTNQGRWGILRDIDLAKHILAVADVSGGATTTVAGYSENLNLEVLHGYAHRTGGASAATATAVKNAATSYNSSAYTADTGSLNTTNLLLIGKLGDATGSAGGTSDLCLDGYVGECAKYSVVLASAARLRLTASRCRKWRIAS